MSANVFELEGFNELSKILEGYEDLADNILKEQELIAKAFVKDLLKLPKPKSNRNTPTHLIDSFTYKIERGEVVVGWGVYYGPMVEKGHAIANKYGSYKGIVKATPHFRKLWEANENKYFKDFKKRNNL